MRTIDLAPVQNLTMTSGIGNADTTACVVAQAAILDQLQQGQAITATDSLECACPVLRTMAIALNDIAWWDSDAERTELLRPLIPALLDSRVGSIATSKRAQLASDFAVIAAKSAAKSAKSAAKSAKYAAEYAEYAKYVEYAAKSAAESAKYAAEYAEYAKYVEYAAKYAAKYAESAEYAAKSVAKSAKSVAKSAKSVAKSAKSAEMRELRAKLLKCFWACEAVKD